MPFGLWGQFLLESARLTLSHWVQEALSPFSPLPQCWDNGRECWSFRVTAASLFKEALPQPCALLTIHRYLSPPSLVSESFSCSALNFEGEERQSLDHSHKYEIITGAFSYVTCCNKWGNPSRSPKSCTKRRELEPKQKSPWKHLLSTNLGNF